MINPEEIKKSLKSKLIGKRILFYEEIDSTNLEALRLINNSSAKHGDVIIAKTQTSGKGQQDKSWESPEGGIYISIITASKVFESSNLITFVSGIACAEAIKSLIRVQPQLKWVNDIIYNNRKLGGILTEVITRGNISINVSGIGINVTSTPKDIEDTRFAPISLSEIAMIDINFLIAEICSQFENYFDIYQIDSPKILNKWLKYSNTIGKKVSIPVNKSCMTGIAENINELGHLIVNISGEKYTLTSTAGVDIFYN